MSKTCPICNSEVLDDSRFCGMCGAPIGAPAEDKDGFTKTLVTPIAGISVGSLLAGKYRVLEEVGRGGMGVVYKAEDLSLKRDVALKFLSPRLTGDPNAKQRFIQEARAAAALDHPNICTVYEAGEISGELYLAMSFVEGRSLKDKVKSGPLPIEEVTGIAIRVAEALETAHGRGIVHRDIKPSNIMLDSRGLPKVMDFGLAKLGGGAQLTHEGTTMGTPAYMSPEQANGEPVDQRADIWSLGTVLYEMLTGRPPFEGENDASLLYAIVHKRHSPPRDLRPDIPETLAGIVERAMAKSRAERYQTASEMLIDLRDFDRSQRGEEAGIKDLKSFLRWARRPYLYLPAVGALAVLAVILALNIRRNAKVRWARNAVIPEIVEFVRKHNYLEAFKLAKEIKPIIPNDKLLEDLWNQSVYANDIKLDPEAAKVYVKDLRDIEKPWVLLDVSARGVLPIGDSTGWMPLWKVEKEGYDGAEIMGYGSIYVKPQLTKSGSLPERMVRVRCGSEPFYDSVLLQLDAYEYHELVKTADFFLDKYEVTNREYKLFVDSGGYEKPEYWKHPLINEGRALSRDEATQLLCDKTGRPGPATWEYGTYPEGQDDFPVGGISWYEAAAYAEFAGKSLPSVYHWSKAASINFCGEVISGSNFGSKGTAPVGGYKKSIGEWGTYDIAGNVREWCFNAVAGEDERFVLGGAWNDPAYLYVEPSTRPSFDRSPENGFRCMKLMTSGSDEAKLSEPLKRRPARDWSREKPLSDEEFETWMSFISYPPMALNAKTEQTRDDPPYWREEKISFDAAYDGERMKAFLLLPKGVAPPYQAIVIWPPANPLYSSEDPPLGDPFLGSQCWEHLVRGGRAVLIPVLKGTFSRGGLAAPFDFTGAWKRIRDRDLTIRQLKDIMRSIDLLESRDDIDKSKIAIYGFSWGAYMGPVACAVEKRLKAGISVSGQLLTKDEFGSSHWGWCRRCRTPMLLISGEFDTTFRYKERQQPFFDALGTPASDKNLVVLPDGHQLTARWNDVIRESLAWLDKYLGRIKKSP